MVQYLSNNMNFLLQAGNVLKTEKSCILTYADGKTEYAGINTDLSLEKYRNFCPVGSVEFVKKFAKEQEIRIPYFPTYPEELKSFLKREIEKVYFKDVKDDWFVKPVECKIFTGGIKNQIVEKINPLELCYTSAPINLDSEWRFYVVEGKVLGYGSYAGWHYPDKEHYDFVDNILSNMSKKPAGFSIDIGTTEPGEILLIEVNDGWSLGY